MARNFAAIFILFFSLNCGDEETSCEIKATLKDYASLDGCGFVLVLEDGEVLEMGDFDEEPDFSFNDGMKVRISYEEMSNMASICMVGPKVNITCMEKIK